LKIIIVGVGSIGTRHLKNLAGLGHEVHAVDINEDRLKAASGDAKSVFTSLDEALKIQPDIAFICTFSNDHIIPAMKCAEAGCHLFIEKPLSLTLDGTDDLIRIVKERNIITLAGCNMRFHPAISYIYKTINENQSYGRRLWADLEFGYYLPFDKKDYEVSYKANKSMGGNLIFDMIHELDYACWFFGEPDKVICTKGILSDLKIDTEDSVDMIVKFKSGVTCTIHMDYLQHSYTRRCKVVCEKATIFWDFIDGKIGTVTTADGKWSWKEMKLELQYNQMYMDEVKYFMDSVTSGRQTFNTIEQSVQALKLAIAANKSCSTERWEEIK
jgi:predicted dehydrogenase